MTILKKMSCLFLTTAMFFACEDDGPIITGPVGPGGNTTTQFFEGTLDLQKISGSPVQYEPVLMLNVRYQGSGTSNMMSHLSLEATHLEEIIPNGNDFNVVQGEFRLMEDAGEEIYGTYRGHGSSGLVSSQLNWTLQIEGGTGRFASAQGNLNLVVPDPDYSGNFMQARISGNIGLVEDPKPL